MGIRSILFGKRKTLPENFEELLSKGNMQELKAVFNKCEANARGGYGKQTALAFDNCPHEFAKWLVENGADLHAPDTWGNTPLHSRSRSYFGNIISLLELGADVNNAYNSVGTPLHAAAAAHKAENTALLIKYGARIDAMNSAGYTPLELALSTCNNIDILETVRIAEMYLNAGIPVTPKMQGFVAQIGKQFEFHRSNFNKNSVDEVSSKLEELYILFGVEPIAKRVMHDGNSLITTNAKKWQEQYQELWDLLVPSKGPAKTIQGEVIRISGRIGDELERNGRANWDDDYIRMAKAFLIYVKMGNPLSAYELKETEEIINNILRNSDDTARMTELGVKWVIENPQPLQLMSVEYKR